ncbi:hypothetical protein [Neobacillus vireti]|uniref:Uncharacterized protein n=1 Tax=Neobacillus vireti LMG 21834 TaxID=1131730 RepID=A0AB94IRH9_9BACI|nr:hypothetical protein [Neobacillus vireti]ETI69654.1 hypothetical protein BAVI_06309 [Neobacillus vireti LMG 21834]KLT18245.1 hypothetical protein AA980_07855 [Neobacillus vireti]
MLTAAQQKVKQELEELHAKGHFHKEVECSSPASKPSKKKWILSLIGVLLFCSFMIIHFSFSNHEEIVSYLTIEQNYSEQSVQLLNDILEKRNLDQEAQEVQTKFLSKEMEVKAPASFKNHHQDMIAAMEQRLTIVSYLAGKNIDPVRLNKYLIELDVKQELAADSLLKAFDREKIEYVVKDDGTVQYWINSKSYQIN